MYEYSQTSGTVSSRIKLRKTVVSKETSAPKSTVATTCDIITFISKCHVESMPTTQMVQTDARTLYMEDTYSPGYAYGRGAFHTMKGVKERIYPTYRSRKTRIEQIVVDTTATEEYYEKEERNNTYFTYEFTWFFFSRRNWY
jgi:hypothetical protein